jgi:NAD(P)-dependent dehydrogenase (short-subunit alcohol dehydrogenase family)
MTTSNQNNTVALVSGANKSIGFETARQLGHRGITVLLGARDDARGAAAEKLLRDEGIDASAVSLDVTDEDSINAAAAWVEARVGRLDVLVNNAAITGSLNAGSPSATPVAVLREVYETNVFGVVALTNAVLPLLRRSPAGRIVNVSSEVGSLTSQLDQDGPLWSMAFLAYPSSKTALNMVTAMYAKELWDTHVKVNAANPGYCATDLNGHTGFRTAAQGAEPVVALATLPDDGPTGTFSGHLWVRDAGPDAPEYGPLPW